VDELINAVFEQTQNTLKTCYNINDIKSSKINSVVTSSCVKSSILDSDSLAVAELVYKCRIREWQKPDSEQDITVLLFIDVNKIELLGRIKIKNALPCSLEELINNYCQIVRVS